jgi:hypothetical protein
MAAITHQIHDITKKLIDYYLGEFDKMTDEEKRIQYQIMTHSAIESRSINQLKEAFKRITGKEYKYGE